MKFRLKGKNNEKDSSGTGAIQGGSKKELRKEARADRTSEAEGNGKGVGLQHASVQRKAEVQQIKKSVSKGEINDYRGRSESDGFEKKQAIGRERQGADKKQSNRLGNGSNQDDSTGQASGSNSVIGRSIHKSKDSGKLVGKGISADPESDRNRQKYKIKFRPKNKGNIVIEEEKAVERNKREGKEEDRSKEDERRRKKEKVKALAGAPSAEAPSSDALAVANVSNSSEKQAISIVAERRNKLPIFRGPATDIDEELSKIKLVPGLHCSVCSVGVECPEFKEGSVCAYEKSFKAFPTRDALAVIEFQRFLIDKNKERLLRGMHIEETVNGGELRADVTQLSGIVIEQLGAFLELSRDVEKVSVHMEEPAGKAGGGVISRLFGQQNKEKPALQSAVLEVPVEEQPILTEAEFDELDNDIPE